MRPAYWLPPGPDRPRRTWQRRSRIPVIVGGTLLLAVLAAITIIALALGSSPGHFTARGRVVIDSRSAQLTDGGGCVGSGRFSAVVGGAALRIGYGEHPDAFVGELSDGEVDGNSCVFSFSVDDVTSGHGTYSLQIADVVDEKVSEHDLRSGIRLTLF
ncbi:hypothetical protein GCM10027169_10890 [Gordonia jinhuaensis]|uniref:Uncharacterized protein n=1 Tax=Gordonia jinhuaensis TaxID=1517702 RepID=A0A916WQF0_9ACTN|nr:hypothetical protein [Gordonia jinhuaensis]GGB19891.1 hypothetical protein GCM10011489_05050 [Gordonia jinhuaensis]